MLVAAAEQGLLDLRRAMNEGLLSFRRAGTDVIVAGEARARARVFGG
jgi:delta-aminolevulinic acid dehydratase/porphobilinogen synthase